MTLFWLLFYSVGLDLLDPDQVRKKSESNKFQRVLEKARFQENHEQLRFT